MSQGIAIRNGDKVLKYCFNCREFKWAKQEGNHFVCLCCNERIANWITKQMLEVENG